MMKHRYSLFMVMFLSITVSLQAQTGEFETAAEAVQNMRVGWNLGNTFDSHQIGISDVTKTETLRGQPVTTPELMEMMKMAGFNAIRIPVTWYPHLDSSGNIQTAWLNRIEEVVNYVLDMDMYCIINIHHDTGKTGNSNQNKGWLRAKMSNYNKNKVLFEKIWRQVANRFKNYDQRLIFEGFNEMLDTLDSWRYPSYKAPGEYDADVAQSGYDAINAYNSSFVQTVRATGGKNAYRNLIIKPYAACDARIPGGHNPDPFEYLNKPENSNHIIIGIHSYPAIVAKNSNGVNVKRPKADWQAEVMNTMTFAKTYFIDRYNAPVIIGEWGTSNVDANPTDYDAFRDYMFEFVDYYVKKAKEYNMATFYWMGLSNGKTPRSRPYFNQADLAQKILKAYYGSDYRPMTLTTADYAESGYKVTFTKQWAELSLVKSSSNLRNTYIGVEVVLDTVPNVSGNLSFRAYPSQSNDNNYENKANITSKVNTLYFSDVALSTIQRATIVWRSTSGTPTLKIRQVLLIRKDGTKEKVVPVVKNACTIEDLVVRKFVTSQIGKTTYATLYYGYENLVVPPYVTAKAYKVDNGNLTVVKTYNEGDIIPKGTGVILESPEGTVYKFTTTDATGSAATGSMMRGTDYDATTTGGSVYYKLSLNAALDANSIGFYFGAAGGGAFLNGAHKAYLAVPEGSALAPRFLFDDSTTGIETIESHAEKHKQTDNYWYTLDGRRMNHKPTVKGVYIHQQQKVVIGN